MEQANFDFSLNVAKGFGSDWFLDKVQISTGDGRDYFFLCGKWLDKVIWSFFSFLVFIFVYSHLHAGAWIGSWDSSRKWWTELQAHNQLQSHSHHRWDWEKVKEFELKKTDVDFSLTCRRSTRSGNFCECVPDVVWQEWQFWTQKIGCTEFSVSAKFQRHVRHWNERSRWTHEIDYRTRQQSTFIIFVICVFCVFFVLLKKKKNLGFHAGMVLG